MSKNMICIEGNIGVGKTTLIRKLEDCIPDAEFVFEPVDTWKNIKDENGENILQKFYNDQERWAYSFQTLAYITYMKEIEDIIKNSKANKIVLDRSLDTNKYIFEKMLYNNGKISEIEHKMYHLWFDFYHKYVKNNFNNIIIYLRCEPEIASERIKKRGRVEEKDITIEYLTQLHNYHDEWLLNKDNVLVVDCSNDIRIYDIITFINSKIKQDTKYPFFSW
jgi:deoxyguanosine kinase